MSQHPESLQQLSPLHSVKVLLQHLHDLLHLLLRTLLEYVHLQIQHLFTHFHVCLHRANRVSEERNTVLKPLYLDLVFQLCKANPHHIGVPEGIMAVLQIICGIDTVALPAIL